MRICIDIEANGLHDPTHVWLIVCQDIDTDEYYIFRSLSQDEEEKKRFLEFARGVDLWVGHNWLNYDYPVLHRLLGLSIENVSDISIDTLIISKLVDYSREGGHSIEQYGEEFGIEKGIFFKFTDPLLFNKTSNLFKQMETYCVRDVDICRNIYTKYSRILNDPSWHKAIQLEHSFQLVVNALHSSGFGFDAIGARRLLDMVTKLLEELDKDILEAFPPKEVLIREFTPKITKFGTINKASVPRVLHERICEYEAGKTYKHTKLVEFNPASPKQVVEVLTDARWSPTDKTKGHTETERALLQLKRNRTLSEIDLAEQSAILVGKLEKHKKFGFKINEHNLSSLPETAPAPARLLAKRILLESRRRTLTEWLGLVHPDTSRIHGSFYGIGAWTHRMAHQKPNTANIPNDKKEDGSTKLLGNELRSLWQAPQQRLLVGVDAEGIQLRIFAHYIDDKEFTDALVRGSKTDKTDPHSLNQRILGDVCKTRQAAKRFIFALLLGAGLAKLGEVLDCNMEEARKALDRVLKRYSGFKKLKQEVIPADAKQGWFLGLDGRKVKIPGKTTSERSHLSMSGYLQNGEAIVIKTAAVIAAPKLIPLDSFFVDIVHDEFQSETPADMKIAMQVAKIKADAIREAGEVLKLKCPMAGSFKNDDGYTIGNNWSLTH